MTKPDEPKLHELKRLLKRLERVENAGKPLAATAVPDARPLQASNDDTKPIAAKSAGTTPSAAKAGDLEPPALSQLKRPPLTGKAGQASDMAATRRPHSDADDHPGLDLPPMLDDLTGQPAKKKPPESSGNAGSLTIIEPNNRHVMEFEDATEIQPPPGAMRVVVISAITAAVVSSIAVAGLSVMFLRPDLLGLDQIGQAQSPPSSAPLNGQHATAASTATPVVSATSLTEGTGPKTARLATQQAVPTPVSKLVGTDTEAKPDTVSTKVKPDTVSAEAKPSEQTADSAPIETLQPPKQPQAPAPTFATVERPLPVIVQTGPAQQAAAKDATTTPVIVDARDEEPEPETKQIAQSNGGVSPEVEALVSAITPATPPASAIAPPRVDYERDATAEGALQAVNPEPATQAVQLDAASPHDPPDPVPPRTTAPTVPAPSLAGPQSFFLEHDTATKLPLSVNGQPDDLAGHSVILVGFTRNVSVSRGTSLLFDTWQVPVAAIADLEIKLPAGLARELPLDLELRRPDGLVVDQRSFVLTTGGAPKVLALTQAEFASVTQRETPQISKLVHRAERLIDNGDALSARLLLERAYNQGSALAAWMLAISYDPQRAVALSVPQDATDEQRAATYYRRAADLGMPIPESRR